MRRRAEPSLRKRAKGKAVEAPRAAEVVGKKKPRVVAQIGRPEQPAPRPMPLRKRCRQQNRKPDRVVEGKNPQGAANVEVAIAVRTVLAVVEDAGDEEPRKDEEDVDARPSPAEDIDPGRGVVLAEDHERGDGAEAVECGVMAAGRVGDCFDRGS